MSAYQPSRNPQTVSLVNKLFAVFITLTPSESFNSPGFFLLQWRCILPACLLTQYRISTRLTWRPGKITGGQVDSVDVGERLQQPVSGADGSIRVLPQHRYGNGVGTVRDVEVLRPDRSQVQNFGIGVEGLVAVSVSVLRKNVSARSRSQNSGGRNFGLSQSQNRNTGLCIQDSVSVSILISRIWRLSLSRSQDELF